MRALALLPVLALLSVALLAPASGQEPVAISIEGPTAVAPRSVHRYFANVTGGPAEGNGTYSIEYYLEGAALSGGSPLPDAKGLANSENGTFEFDVTTPTAETTYELVVRATSTNTTTQANASAVLRLAIESKSPISLEASFTNTGTVAAVHVRVDFFVDGTKVGSGHLARVDPQQSATANYTWIPIGIRDGSHSLEARADLNGNGVIEASAGEVSASSVFVRSAGGLSLGLAIILITAILGVGLLAVLALRARLKASR